MYKYYTHNNRCRERHEIMKSIHFEYHQYRDTRNQAQADVPADAPKISISHRHRHKNTNITLPYERVQCFEGHTMNLRRRLTV